MLVPQQHKDSIKFCKVNLDFLLSNIEVNQNHENPTETPEIEIIPLQSQTCKYKTIIFYVKSCCSELIIACLASLLHCKCYLRSVLMWECEKFTPQQLESSEEGRLNE